MTMALFHRRMRAGPANSPDHDKSLRILVNTSVALGDVIMMIPMLKALKRHYPNCHIEVMITQAPAEEILRPCPFVDDVVLFYNGYFKERREKKRVRAWPFIRIAARRLIQLAELLKRLRKRPPDIILNHYNSRLPDLALVSLFSGVPRRIGYSSNRYLNNPYAFASNFHVEFIDGGHFIEQNLRLLKPLGIDEPATVPDLSWLPQGRATRGGLAAGKEILIGVAPGTGIFQWKQWPPERWAELLQRLGRSYSCAFVFLGSPLERPLVEQITGLLGEPAVNAAGSCGILESFHILSLCDIVLAVDNGLAHTAAAMEKPVVALFGPTDARYCRPFGPKAVAVEPPGSWPRLDYGKDAGARTAEFEKVMTHLFVAEVLERVVKQIESIHGKG